MATLRLFLCCKLLLLACLILLPAALFAQCGGCCSCRADTVSTAGYEWSTTKGADDQLTLWKGNTQVGGWSISGQIFRPYDAKSDTWGPACNPPIAVPDYAKVQYPVLTGMNSEKLSGATRYILNGVEVSRPKAVEAITNGLVDDSAKWRLTVIGTESDAKKVMDDLNTDHGLAVFKGKYLLRHMEPDEFDLKEMGFVTSGKPTIYVQAPSGKVLHRQDEYRGPIKLAEALRKADANYNPKKDPDLNRRALDLPDLSGTVFGLPGWAWLAGGALMFFAIRKQ